MIRGKTARTGSVFLEREFATFFKENYSRLYYYALHFIPDPEVCKDIVSDSFHFMWERIGIDLYVYSCLSSLYRPYKKSENQKESYSFIFVSDTRTEL